MVRRRVGFDREVIRIENVAEVAVVVVVVGGRWGRFGSRHDDAVAIHLRVRIGLRLGAFAIERIVGVGGGVDISVGHRLRGQVGMGGQIQVSERIDFPEQIAHRVVAVADNRFLHLVVHEARRKGCLNDAAEVVVLINGR